MDAAASMDISERAFFEMTPREFSSRQRGQRRHLEAMRMQTFLICSHSGNMKKGTTPRRFWPLPWDNETVVKFEPQDPVEAAAFRDRASKIFELKRHGNNSGT